MEHKRAYNKHFGELGAAVAQRWPEKETIAAKGKEQHTLGLALSGGGYRSAIFNYGILKGLHKLGVIPSIDYLSVVSGGSWIGAAFALTEDFRHFFYEFSDHPNFVEEGFESLLPNPLRVAQEAVLARKTENYLSNIFGRLLARTFLREQGTRGRTAPLSEPGLVKDDDRPFLLVNGTVYFRRPDGFDVIHQCFEMTRLYCGCRSLGYVSTKDLKATSRTIRARDAIAVSGAALAAHIPALGDEVAGFGLSREVRNYTRRLEKKPPRSPDSAELDLADGGFYNNLGVESLINRGCRYLIVVDAEHDPETKAGERSNQKYTGLKTLLKRHHIKIPKPKMSDLDRANEAVHLLRGNRSIPEVLYIKLKSCDAYDEIAKDKPYNEPGFFRKFRDAGHFSFDPQFSTAKLDYDFAEHRNLSELGEFFITSNEKTVRDFVAQSH